MLTSVRPFIVAFGMAALASAASPIFVDTPTLVVACQSKELIFGGGTPPYFLSVTYNDGTAFIGETSNTSFTWLVNDVPAGAIVNLTVEYSGMPQRFAQSASFPIFGTTEPIPPCFVGPQ